MSGVLIVDDQIHVRELIRAILRGVGLTVVAEASHGLEAIERYKEYRPDVVTMDVVMPHLNGVEAATMILEHDPGARIIAVSGLHQTSVRTELAEAGCRAFVPKPIDPDRLIGEIRTLLRS